MQITDQQPIPFTLQLNEQETATLLNDLRGLVGPGLPAGMLEGRTFTNLSLSFTNLPGKPQTAKGSIQIALVPAAPTPKTA